MSNDLSNKRIISCALTGAWPTREDNPNLPCTPQELADDAYEAWKAGAAIVHIHVRDKEGKPTLDYKLYEETIRLIREKKDCDVCINISSSGGDLLPRQSDEYDEERIKPIRELLPEMCSMDCGTLNWQNRIVFENHPIFLEKLGKGAIEWGVKPEVEIFDGGMIYNAIHYIKTGVLKAPCHFQFIMGAAGGLKATVENLVFLKNLLPEGSTWAASGIGQSHMPIMYATVAMGGHLRVGLEDNVFYKKGEIATGNAQLVARAKRVIEEAGLEAATASEAREILGLVRHY